MSTDVAVAAKVAASPSEFAVVEDKFLSAWNELKSFLGIATTDIDAAQPLIGASLAVANPAVAGVETAAVGALDATNAVVQAGSVTGAVQNAHAAIQMVQATIAAVKSK